MQTIGNSSTGSCRKLLLLAVITSEIYRRHTTNRVSTTSKNITKFLKVLLVFCIYLWTVSQILTWFFSKTHRHFHNKYCSTSADILKLVSHFEVSWLMCKQLWKIFTFFDILLYKIRTPKHNHTAILWKQEAVII